MRWHVAILGLLLTSAAHAQTDSEAAADEATLRAQKLPTHGASLLQILRQRTPTPGIIDQVKKHVAKLSVDGYPGRLKATGELLKMGPVVRPLLENLLRDIKTDAETLARLREVRDHFPPDQDFAAVSAAARLIARDKPEGCLQVLLDFVPYATDESVRQDVQRTISMLARDKKSLPLLLATLKDVEGARRAAAGEALLRGGRPEAHGKVDPLFKDSNPLVQYQLGMALVETKNKTGVPLLIKAIGEAPSDRVEYALDLLYRVAGDKAPSEPYPGKQKAQAYSATWAKWYDKNQAGLDLAKQLAKPDLGYTVIAVMGLRVNAGHKVLELGPTPANAIRWEFDASRSTYDLQVLGPNRLLLAEYSDNRVTERNFKGEILKQFPVRLPIACQRLPNGHTFIAARQQLLIVDREGREVFTLALKPPSIMAAQRLKNGQFAVVSSGGRCALLDAHGTELKSFQLGGTIYTLGGNIEVLPNGHILAPLYNTNTIAEFDWNGNRLWQATIHRPIGATRLSNGHTLVTCSLDSRVVEIDENGKEVWTYQTDGRPYRARRR